MFSHYNYGSMNIFFVFIEGGIGEEDVNEVEVEVAFETFEYVTLSCYSWIHRHLSCEFHCKKQGLVSLAHCYVQFAFIMARNIRVHTVFTLDFVTVKCYSHHM